MSDITFRNYMEDCVMNALTSVIDSMDVCKCQRCKMDITVYALNKLPPKYVVSEKGQLFAKIDEMHSQFNADIVSAIIKGAKVVGKNPWHG